MAVVNGVQSSFLALISHELRSPIQAILGWAEIVDSGSIDAKLHRTLYGVYFEY